MWPIGTRVRTNLEGDHPAGWETIIQGYGHGVVTGITGYLLDGSMLLYSEGTLEIIPSHIDQSYEPISQENDLPYEVWDRTEGLKARCQDALDAAQLIHDRHLSVKFHDLYVWHEGELYDGLFYPASSESAGDLIEERAQEILADELNTDADLWDDPYAPFDDYEDDGYGNSSEDDGDYGPEEPFNIGFWFYPLR
jgi:hypothetical protein